MVWVANRGYTGGDQRQSQMGQKLAQSLGGIFAGPDPETIAEFALTGAKARNFDADTALKSDQFYANNEGIRDLLNDPSLFTEDGGLDRARLGDVFSMSYRGGRDDVGKDLLRPLLAMTGDGSQMRRGLISAGQMPDVNTALSMGESNQISSRDAAESYREAIGKQSLANVGDLDVQRLKNTGDLEQKRALIGLLTGDKPLGSIFQPQPQSQNMQGPIDPNQVIDDSGFGVGATQAGDSALPIGGEGPPQMDFEDIANKLGVIGAATGDVSLLNTSSIMADRAARMDSRRTESIDKQITNYAKQTEDLAPLLESTQSLFGNLSSYGLEDDLPGFGATGMAPSWMLSSEGKKLRQDVSSVGNAIIKARSGQAVSNQEAERLANELGYSIQGNVLNPLAHKSDEELRIGIGNIMRQLDAKLKNVGTVLTPEALEEYKSRGGPMSPNMFTEDMLKYGIPATGMGDAASGLPEAAIMDGVSPEEWNFMSPQDKALYGG